MSNSAEFLSNLIKDLLEADNEMSLDELYTHCKIISEHNGISQAEVSDLFPKVVKLIGRDKK